MQENYINTNKYGTLLFIEVGKEPDGVSSIKATNVFTPARKYITTINEYWWNLDGIQKAMDNLDIRLD